MTNIVNTNFDDEDKAVVDNLYENIQSRPGEYHVKLEDGDIKDLWFIKPKEIKVRWKKFNKKGEPPTILDHKPEPDEVDNPDDFKEMWTFPIYDPEEDKEGFIEFASPPTIKGIMTYLHGTEKIPATNFLRIMRVGTDKATRYGVKAAKG